MSNEKMWYPILGHPNVSILPVATAPACGTRPLTLESRLQVEIEMSLFERPKFRLRHRAIGGERHLMRFEYSPGEINHDAQFVFGISTEFRPAAREDVSNDPFGDIEGDVRRQGQSAGLNLPAT